MFKKTPNLLQQFGEYLVKNPLKNNVLVFILSLTPLVGLPLDWLSRVILIFITLAQGYKAGLVTAAWCLLPAVAIGLTMNLAILGYIGFIVLLTWVSGVMLRYFRCLFPVIESMAMVGCCIVIAFHIIIPDITQWWVKLLSQYSLTLTTSLNLSSQDQAIFQSVILPRLAPYATGLQVMILLLGTLFNTVIAKSWCEWVYPHRLSKTSDPLKNRWRISHTMALLLLTTSVLGGIMGFAPLRDMLPLFIVPFILSGFYLTYALTSQHRYASIALVAFIMVCLYQPYLLSTIILAAWIDSWYDLPSGLTKSRS